ncbi:MAG: hypothetical protein ABSE40_00555 [Candidatus Sulfotelmatobacter sp.]|jgi:hypothetical protein
MTLLDAKEIDVAKERKRKRWIIAAVVAVLIVAFIVWWNRFLPEKLVAGHFFDALQKQDYNTAYGIWMRDPDWRQHPERHPKYPFGDFYRDWGPGGEWGLIKTQKVYGASTCPGGGSGIVVDVVVNDRAEHAQVWVEKSDRTMSYPPCELMFH